MKESFILYCFLRILTLKVASREDQGSQRPHLLLGNRVSADIWKKGVQIEVS